MRAAEADILMVPGLSGADPGLWQSRWEARLSTARRIEAPQGDGHEPDRRERADRLLASVADAARPVVLVAHSFGVLTVADAARRMGAARVKGAFLVAPSDPEASGALPRPDDAPVSVRRDPLPFPSLLVASRTDPHCAFERAEDLAQAWGSLLLDAGDAGGIDAASGFGPWPEGLMAFARFLARL